MKILIALLIFSLIVIIHELGHFLLAKWNGVVVTEFSLGMGPRIISFDKGGTKYSWKLLPFGGSCMMLGEDMEEEGEGTFGSKSVWARISVIAAGPIFNFILAYVLSVFIIGSIGFDQPVLLNVSEGYPAAEAGIQAGDTITKINGKTIRLYREISNYVTFHQKEMQKGKTLQVQYVHDGETKVAELTPVDNGSGRYVIGISGSTNNRTKANSLQVLKYSAYEVKYWIDTTFDSLKMLLQGGVKLDDVSGPVGVVDMIGDTYEESQADGAFYVWLNMLNIAILLTANLGVMNLLPLPALDGGRLVFLILEAIRRKRVNPETEAKIHFAGLMLLLLLMVVVMFNDIKKIFL
ncbi:MAG: RIP metalloprotease RseP [Lachnospiraceae bacterium]|nr:RIP metalloprotease RseP [Lachnospiraceae bacterium]MDD3797489.1 RIP metalloprotease RseP [Lachnospiraceae bacterium]